MPAHMHLCVCVYVHLFVAEYTLRLRVALNDEPQLRSSQGFAQPLLLHICLQGWTYVLPRGTCVARVLICMSIVYTQ